MAKDEEPNTAAKVGLFGFYTWLLVCAILIVLVALE